MVLSDHTHQFWWASLEPVKTLVKYIGGGRINIFLWSWDTCLPPPSGGSVPRSWTSEADWPIQISFPQPKWLHAYMNFTQSLINYFIP